MNQSKATGTAWEGPGDRARLIIREYRDMLLGYAAVQDTEDLNTSEVPTQLRPLADSELPVEMRHLLTRYEREHPETVVQPVAYFIVGTPDATRGAAGFADLPREEDLVILSLTETVASADRVEARSQVLLLRCSEKR